jgi:acyl carrier protein
VNHDINRAQNWIPGIESIFRTVLNNSEIALTKVTTRSQVAGWNQVTHLDILTALEKGFGIRFTTSEVWKTSQANATIGELLEILTHKASEYGKDLKSGLLSATSPSQRRQILEDHLRRQLASVLGAAVKDIDKTIVFKDMGVTSLMVIELCVRLEMSLGVSVPPTMVYGYPSLEQLAVALERKVGLEPCEERPASPLSKLGLERVLREIEELSEEEAERLLHEDVKGRAD